MEEEEEDEEPIQIGASSEPNETTAAMCLIGKLWTERSYNTFALMETMKKLWNPVKGMTCHDLGCNLVAFQFNSIKDMKRVQDMEPWHFNKHVLVLKQITDDVQPSAIKYNTAPIWIRVYDLPFIGRDENTITQLGKRVGEVLAIDKESCAGMTRSVRLKVEIQLDKPLKRGIRVRIGKAEPVWLPITYERLPSFCYACGKLGHTHKDCDTTDDKEEELHEDELRYGYFLRASPHKQTVVKVEKRGNNRDDLRKSLFAGKKEEVVQEADQTVREEKENVGTENQICELLNSLESVNFKIPENEEQSTPQMEEHRGEIVRAINQITPNKHLLKPTILHPTTKTLTPSHITNTTQVPLNPSKNTPHSPKKPTATDGNAQPTQQVPVPPKIPQKTQTKQPTNKPTPTPSHHQTTNIYTDSMQPTLIPIATLIDMVQSSKTTISQRHHPSPQKPVNQSSNVAPITQHQNHDHQPEKNEATKKWRRMVLKTPKIEGESVLLGKRETDDGGIPTRPDFSAKRSKRGIDNATVAPAEAEFQPRRAS